MSKSPRWQCIPTHLSLKQFEQFVLPHLTRGSRGPKPNLSLHSIFNYILQALYLGCQWKELPIEKDQQGRPEIHYTRIYSAFRRWQAKGVWTPFSAVQLRHCRNTVIWTSASFMAMARPQPPRRAATTSASAATRKSKAIKSSPSAIAIAM